MTRTEAAQEFRTLAALLTFAAENSMEAGRADIAAWFACHALLAAEAQRAAR